MSTHSSSTDTAERLSDQASHSADAALRSTQRFVNEAELLARRGMAAVADGSGRVRDRALRASDSTVGYIKDEPFRAVLIAAAAGAAVMGLLAYFSRSRSRY